MAVKRALIPAATAGGNKTVEGLIGLGTDVKIICDKALIPVFTYSYRETAFSYAARAGQMAA